MIRVYVILQVCYNCTRIEAETRDIEALLQTKYWAASKMPYISDQFKSTDIPAAQQNHIIVLSRMHPRSCVRLACRWL